MRSTNDQMSRTVQTVDSVPLVRVLAFRKGEYTHIETLSTTTTSACIVTFGLSLRTCIGPMITSTALVHNPIQQVTACIVERKDTLTLKQPPALLFSDDPIAETPPAGLSLFEELP